MSSRCEESEMSQSELYAECIAKQLEEIDLLSSIYCTPGEMQILEPSVIIDFNDFLKEPQSSNANKLLKHNLDFIVKLSIQCGDDDEEIAAKEKYVLEVRIELPHLYPKLENAIVIIHSALLSKGKEQHLKLLLGEYIETMDKNEGYVFQILSWIQEQMPDMLKHEEQTSERVGNPTKVIADFERLWIYSHHIRSKAKRHEILRQARTLDLSGFCRPGKPGIICVEGIMENTQSFWQTIRVLTWKKISICKSEVRHQIAVEKINDLRRFEGFKEQLFCDDAENDSAVMDMSAFIKFLELHKSAYMKKELFGLD